MSQSGKTVETTNPNLKVLPWKVKLVSRVLPFIYSISLRPNITVNRRVLNFLDPKVPPSPKPRQGVSSFDVTVDSSRDVWFRIYTPTTTTAAEATMPVLIFYHGGGFVLSHANSYFVDAAARRFAQELRAVVVSVNYRLSPEHRFPCQYEDGFDALRFLDEMNVGDFPVSGDRRRCFVAGESAGGNLAHHVLVKASGYGFKNLNIIGVIAIQPFFGGEERVESELRFVRGPVLTLEDSDWFWKAFLPEGSDRDHPAVNVFGPKADDISGVRYPDTLLFVGGLDPLRDRGMMYYEGLKKCGKQVHLVEYPNGFHGFSGFTEVPESSLFINEVRVFMQNQLAKI